MTPETLEEQLARLRQENTFLQNWLTDLLEAVDSQLEPGARLRLYATCGRGCYSRFSFKQEIARQGRGSLENLLRAYQQNFEAWREDGLVHIRYGARSPGCYCPAARSRPARTGDLHCECSRATHQAVFEAALGVPVEVEVVESVRRGAQTCHFIVRVSEKE